MDGNIEKLISKVANRMISAGSEEKIVDLDKWEWPQGVSLYGLYKYYEKTKNADIYNYIVNWFEKHIDEGPPQKNINTCAPLLTLTYIYEKEKNEKYLDVIKEWAYSAYNEFPRTKSGGLQHYVTGNTNESQLWVDTLFMTVVFLARAGILLEIPEYIEESKYQFLIHIKYLFDKNTGLWFHGWSFLRNDNYGGIYWGRGNCWYTICAVDFIDIISLKDGAVKKYIIDTLASQVEALQKLQSPNGLWHTLLRDKTSYVEASASAGFAYGILQAVKKGYIEESYKDCAIKAVKALLDCIDEDGTVLNVSFGTGISDDPEYYKTIPIYPMVYGQGLTILCLTAVNQEDLK